MRSRLEVVATARDWLGTPFRAQGRTVGLACDCGGVVIGVAHALGLSDFDIAGYKQVPDGHTLQRLCDENMTRIRVAAMQAGDVLLMTFDKHPQHLAIVAPYRWGGFSIIHALGPESPAKVIETRLDSRWRAHVVAAYQLPGVEP